MVIKKINYSALFTALAAAIAYGGWAVYANYEHGLHSWVMAGIVQGVYAFFSTFFVTYVARLVFFKCKCAMRGILAGFATSFLVMLAIPMGVHCLAGTPDIVQTILPGLIWGSIYLLGFLITLNISQRNPDLKS